MSNTKAEIQAIIKKNLPQEVGDILKQRLEQADEDAKTIITLQEHLNSRNLQISVLQEEVRVYQAFDTRNTTLETREKVVEDKERNVLIETLRYQLTSEQDKTVFAKSVALGLIRNSDFKTTVFSNESQNGYNDSTGRYIQPGATNKSFNETKTTE